MEVTFVIRNYKKPDSLYSQGMQPLIYSMKSCKGFERVGENIAYFPVKFADSYTVNSAPRGDIALEKGSNTSNTNGTISSNQSGPVQGSSTAANGTTNATNSNATLSYVLCFTYTFEHTGDVCYFSNCFPYTYTDLKISISQIFRNPMKSKLVKRRTLCKTIARNSCDILTITEPGASYEDIMNRSVVIVTSRVHPGESNSSYMLQGFLDFITSDSDEAAVLRAM